MAEQLAYFLDRLDSAQEPGGTLLDQTVILYGSSNSSTHDNRNYPLVLAGGGELGLHHGHYLKFSEQVPLSNLFVTMLNAVGCPSDRFADSTSDMTEVVKS